MCDLHSAAEAIREEEASVLYADTALNMQRLHSYQKRNAPFVAAAPLAYLDRVLAGVRAKTELRFRPIPRHRALVKV